MTQPPQDDPLDPTVDFFGRPPTRPEPGGAGGDSEVAGLRREIAELRDLIGRQGRALEAVDSILDQAGRSA